MSEIFGSPVEQDEEEFVVKLDSNTQRFNKENQVSDFSVPDGHYRSKCISVEQNTSKAGNPQFVFTFLGQEREANNRKFLLYTPATGKGAFRTKLVLQAFGVNLPGDQLTFKRKDVLYKDVMLQLQKDAPYNGKINSKIVEITAAPSTQAETVPF